jgi:lysophospholipase L1-like esterase
MRTAQLCGKKLVLNRMFKIHRLPRLRNTLLVCLIPPCLTSCMSTTTVLPPSTTITAGPQVKTPVWAMSWGNSPENALASDTNPGGSEQSLRMIFWPTLSGTQERLHFSNHFGTTPLTLGAVRLAISPTGSAAVDANDVPVTFNGSSSVTIPPGAIITSDTVHLSYTTDTRLAVSMYMKGTFPPLTQNESQVTNSYMTPVNAGDTTKDKVGTSFSQTTTEWFLLSGMDVYGLYQGTVALFGSSPIVGHNSNFGDANSYPVANVGIAGQDHERPSDLLGQYLNKAGYQLGVLNAGVLGDAAGPNSTNSDAIGTEDGIDRLSRDVLQQTNIKTIVISLGSIDIRSNDCNSAPAVENSLTQLIASSAAAGLRVVIATLAPSVYCSNPAAANYGPIPTSTDPYGGEGSPPTNPGMVQRNLVNAWIRTTAVNLPGVVGIADFDKVLADPAHPDFMIPNLNSGDNFHPNGPGYQIMTGSIPLNVLLPASN